MLEVRNLHATIADKEILKGIDLTVKDGENTCHYGTKWFRKINS